MMKGILPQRREDAKRVNNVNDFGLILKIFYCFQKILQVSFVPLRLKRAVRVGVR